MQPGQLPIGGDPSNIHSNQGNSRSIPSESDKAGHHYLFVNSQSGNFELTKDKSKASSLKETHQFIKNHGKNLNQDQATIFTKITPHNQNIKKVDQADIPQFFKTCIKKTISIGSFIRNMGVTDADLIKEIHAHAQDRLDVLNPKTLKHNFENKINPELRNKINAVIDLKIEVEKLNSETNQTLDQLNEKGNEANSIIKKYNVQQKKDEVSLAHSLRDDATKTNSKVLADAFNKAAGLLDEMPQIEDKINSQKKIIDAKRDQIFKLEEQLRKTSGQQISQVLDDVLKNKNDSKEMLEVKKGILFEYNDLICEMHEMMSARDGFTFGTWNAGSNICDYALLFRDKIEQSKERPNFHMLSSKEDQTMVESIEKVRDKLLFETAKNLAMRNDVFSLQEVSGNQRNDVAAFRDMGFEIIRPKTLSGIQTDTSDTAIAINPQKFKDIENRSVNFGKKGDFAIAVATERAPPGKKIAFVSGHIIGFNLEETHPNEMAKEASYGDKSIKNLIDYLHNSCADCDSVFIGADTNTIPEIYRERLQPLEDAGFTMHRTYKPTEAIARHGDKPMAMQERELDFVFVKQNEPKGLMNYLRSIFNKEKVQLTRIIPSTDLSLNPISSPSDHLPVVVRVDAVEKRSMSDIQFDQMLNQFDALLKKGDLGSKLQVVLSNMNQVNEIKEKLKGMDSQAPEAIVLKNNMNQLEKENDSMRTTTFRKQMNAILKEFRLNEDDTHETQAAKERVLNERGDLVQVMRSLTSIRFAEEVEIKAGKETFKAPTNFDDRFPAKESVKKGWSERAPSAQSVRKQVEEHFGQIGQIPPKVSLGGHTTFANLQGQEAISSEQFLKASSDKLFEIALGNKIFQPKAGVAVVSAEMAKIMSTLPNDRIKNQFDLKDALKAGIIDKNQKKEMLTKEEFKMLTKGKTPIDLFQSPEFNSGKKALLENTWIDGEEREFTLTNFRKDELPLFERLIDDFFLSSDVQAAFKQILPISPEQEMINTFHGEFIKDGLDKKIETLVKVNREVKELQTQLDSLKLQGANPEEIKKASQNLESKLKTVSQKESELLNKANIDQLSSILSKMDQISNSALKVEYLPVINQIHSLTVTYQLYEEIGARFDEALKDRDLGEQLKSIRALKDNKESAAKIAEEQANLTESTIMVHMQQILEEVTDHELDAKEVTQAKKMVARDKAPLIEEMQEFSIDLLENDGKPSTVTIPREFETVKNSIQNIWQDLPRTKNPPFIGSMPFLNTAIERGQIDSAHGAIKVGDHELSVASVTRADVPDKLWNQLNPGKKKPIEDRAVVLQQTFIVNGQPVDTTLAVSCDGNKKHHAAAFFSDMFPQEFERILAPQLANSQTIDKSVVLKSMQEAYSNVSLKWQEKMKQNIKELDSATTLNAVFLCPQANGVIDGVCINSGDSRAIILKRDGGVMRAHVAREGQSHGFFSLGKGDSLLIASDGFWHTGTPREIGEVIYNRFHELKEETDHPDLAKIQERVLLEVVSTSALGREDDRNPILIHRP